MHTLIIGGTKGIGRELAQIFAQAGDKVTVTGRKGIDTSTSSIRFEKLDLSSADYTKQIKQLIDALPAVDRFIYSPGYYQEGHITDLSEAQIQDMIQVCGSGFIFAARDILLKQGFLKECIVITSSSQWTPRELEPVYNFAKAGVAHFANGLSLDRRVGKTLVAGPTGTKTAFHAGRGVDMSTYHEPGWVAKQIFEHSKEDYEYKFIKILRNPPEVEVSEKRT